MPLLKLPFCLLFELFFTEQEGIKTRECVCVCIVLIMRRQSHARMIIPFLSGKRTTCLLHIDPANAFFFFLPLSIQGDVYKDSYVIKRTLKVTK